MARLLQRVVARAADRPALADDHGAWTGRELDARVNRWIWALRERGLRTGDRVAFVAGNRRETFAALLGCMHSGLVAVPVNWHLTAGEIAYVLADSGARAVIADADRLAVTAAAAGEVESRVVLGDQAEAGFEAAAGLLAAQPAAEPEEQESGSVLLYTSGTTGQPKGVINNLFVAGAPLVRVTSLVDQLGMGLGIHEPDRTLLVGPWYHSAQMFFSVFPLLAGSSVVLREKFDAESVLRDIDELQIGQCHLVPIQFVRLQRLPTEVRARFSGASLERVWHGGGACPVEVKRAMIDWWGPVFTEYYAATEGGIITLIRSEEWLAKPGSVGRPVPPNELLILSKERAELPRNEEGVIYVRRAPERDFSYRNAPEKTASVHLAPGMFTFGDCGRLDEDGFLYITGRSSDMLISGGVNIYPAEVEAVLQRHPLVREAAVFGIPDEEYGERVHAVLVIDGELSEALRADLDRFCREHLAGFKVPRSYDAVAELPWAPSGKLRKNLLREPYWQAADA
jgi:acyl-CoA synthetase (AMP-forming)/AMP-acid ligase II